MSFFTLLYTVLIRPLELLFEIIFILANRIIGHPGVAIVALSLAMNFLVLPLYRRADAMQKEARDVDKKLHRGVSHIKSTFSGDEKMMVLQTYYRQNNYKPTDALKGSVSLLLEIPFFIAAYQFLSHLRELNGISFGPIADLSSPDGLLTIAGISINILPFLMTAINLISSAIFLKGFPLKSKVQLYGMALFFLVFLYTSPSGLVLYWTLNNIFSLVKTIFYKIKNPRKVLLVLVSVVGIALALFGLFVYEKTYVRRRIFIILLGLVMQTPALFVLIGRRLRTVRNNAPLSPDKIVFSLSCAFIMVLIGLLIPSSVIASSPLEFIDLSYFHHPLIYLVYSGCMAIGTFLVWFHVFFGLSGSKTKVIYIRVLAIACFVMLANYMFFGTDLGTLSSTLKYENENLGFSSKEQLINLAASVLIAVAIYVFICKKEKLFKNVILTMLIAVIGMSMWNMVNISKTVSDFKQQSASVEEETPEFTLSKDGKNVIVLMLDRGMGEYLPYIFNEKPELQKQFDGFTYYTNVISYGAYTNFGAPALFGGYEYTPVGMNLRDDKLLVEKHNEAIKLLPVLFDENGYDVSICDIPYANYSEISDYSIYSDHPDIKCYTATGKMSDPESVKALIETNYRNFFCFSLMKTLPLSLQDTVYHHGDYNQSAGVYSAQIVTDMYTSTGIDPKFMDSYNVMTRLSEMTSIVDSGNSFLMMCNNLTHDPMLLQEPGYEPSLEVDNRAYYVDMSRFTLDGHSINMDRYAQVSHYQTNMATMLLLGEWFDYMRENDVYDNTRIILVSDHGRILFHTSDLILYDIEGSTSIEGYFPLLMVKDFGASGFSSSDEFMTNADTPTLALNGLIENPVNPFTGNPVDNSSKSIRRQYIIASDQFKVGENNGYTFFASSWYSVSGNIWDKENWQYHGAVGVLPDTITK